MLWNDRVIELLIIENGKSAGKTHFFLCMSEKSTNFAEKFEYGTCDEGTGEVCAEFATEEKP